VYVTPIVAALYVADATVAPPTAVLRHVPSATVAVSLDCSQACTTCVADADSRRRSSSR
jgi:hypothetical protein